jgi:hypothetical protein
MNRTYERTSEPWASPEYQAGPRAVRAERLAGECRSRAHGEQCRRRCHPAGRRHGHHPSPEDAGYRRSGQGRGERSPCAAPPRRSGLLGDQGLVLCSAARPPGQASRGPTVSPR